MRSIMTLRLFTINAQDFVALLNAPVHPGLIVLRESGLSRHEQWEWLRLSSTVKTSSDEEFLLNKSIEITAVGQFKIREIPEP